MSRFYLVFLVSIFSLPFSVNAELVRCIDGDNLHTESWCDSNEKRCACTNTETGERMSAYTNIFGGCWWYSSEWDCEPLEESSDPEVLKSNAQLLAKTRLKNICKKEECFPAAFTVLDAILIPDPPREGFPVCAAATAHTLCYYKDGDSNGSGSEERGN